MIQRLAAMLVLLAAPASRASEFLDDLHRAEIRAAADPERVEFASRAIRAWTPLDGGELLAEAYLRRAEGKFARCDDAEAEADAAKARELDPRNDQALGLRARAAARRRRIARGRALMKSGRGSRAARLFQEACDAGCAAACDLAAAAAPRESPPAPRKAPAPAAPKPKIKRHHSIPGDAGSRIYAG